MILADQRWTSERLDVTIGGPDRGMGRDGPIEGDQAHVVTDSHSDQVEIGHLLVRYEVRGIEPCGVEQAEVFLQSLMGCVSNGGAKQITRIAHRHRVQVRWMGYDSDETVLGDGTRCPTVGHPIGEKVAGDAMMLVGGIKQCDQHIDVGVEDHGSTSS